MLSSRAKELLELQRQKYVESLPGKRRRVNLCWRRILSRGWEPDLDDALRTEIHRLAGSAGIYGFEELGEVAQRLDRELASGEHQAGSLGDFGQKISELEQALEEAAN